MTALAAIGPHEILSRLPHVTVQRVGLLADVSVAETLELALEYAPKPRFNAGSQKKTRPHIVDALRAHLVTVFDNKTNTNTW